MFILFGFKTKPHDHGECIAASCPNCHNVVTLRYLTIRRWFTLFFLPVIPLGAQQRMLMCPVCRWAREVPKSAEPLTNEMVDITRQWQSKTLTDAEYEQRVQAYWAFTAGGTGTTASAEDVG